MTEDRSFQRLRSFARAVVDAFDRDWEDMSRRAAGTSFVVPETLWRLRDAIEELRKELETDD